MKNGIIFLVILLLLVGAVFIVLSRQDDVIIIGAIGEYEASSSSASVDSFRATEMAIEELNGAGKHYELKRFNISTYEDKNKLKQDMIEEKVDIVIGPATSSQAISVYDVLKTMDIPVFFTSVSSNDFSGLDDNVFRITDPVDEQSSKLLIAVDEFYDGTLDVFYVSANKGFSLPFAEKVAEGLLEKDRMDHLVEIGPLNLKETQDTIKEHDCVGGIVIIAGPSEAGIIAQLIEDYGKVKTMFFITWSYAERTLEYTMGLESDMYIMGAPEPKDPNQYDRFVNKLREEKNIGINTFSHFGYEVMYYIDHIINESQSTELKDMKEHIYSMEQYKALFNDYEINDTGDGKRGFALYKIENGEYKLLVPHIGK